MHVLIAGYGRLGKAIGQRLLSNTHEVTALRRSVVDSSEINHVAADLLQASTLHQCPDTIDAIVYCPTPDARTPAAYQSIYLDGLFNLLQRYQHLHKLKLILVTSTAVYGQDSGEWVDENSPTQPERFNGKILLQAEALAARSIKHSCSLRLSGLYQGLPQRYVDLLGQAQIDANNLGRWTNRIHVGDAAGLCVHLLESDHMPDVLVGTDSQPVQVVEILHWLAEQQNISLDKSNWPTPATSGKRISNQLALSLGFELQHESFETGFLT